MLKVDHFVLNAMCLTTLKMHNNVPFVLFLQGIFVTPLLILYFVSTLGIGFASFDYLLHISIMLY